MIDTSLDPATVACIRAIKEDRCGWVLYHRSTRRPLLRAEKRRKGVCLKCQVREVSDEPDE